MRKYLALFALALLLPLTLSAQRTALTLAFGYDEFRAPFLESTDINAVYGRKIWKSRLNFELGYERVFASRFMVRTRFALGLDKVPQRTLAHQNNLLPSLWRFGGGESFSLMQDFGYCSTLGESKFSLSLGMGLGFGFLLGGGGWVDGIQSIDNGDPVNESALLKFSEIGLLMQAFAGINYQPFAHWMIGLEQRHELSGFIVPMTVRYDYSDGNHSGSSDGTKWITTDGSRSSHYMPPLVRVSFVF